MDVTKKQNGLNISDEEPSLPNKEIEKKPAESVIAESGDLAGKQREEEYIGRLAAIVESSNDAIVSKTLDGIIKTWNKGGEEMFGYTAEEAIGKHISMIIPQEYINREKRILERIRNNEIIDHYETVRKKKNGKWFYVSLTVSPIKDSAGNIVGVSKIARDITFQKNAETERFKVNAELIFQNEEKEKRAAELIIANKELAFQNKEKEKRAAELVVANKELIFQNEEKERRAAELVVANKELAFQNEEKEKRAAELIVANKELAFQNAEKEDRAEELAAANKELESFSYSVSHDLRAPLRAVNGYSRILEEDYDALFDTEGKRLLREIQSNAQKMGELIDDLLAFSRLGKKEVKKAVVDMNVLIKTVLSEIMQATPFQAEIHFSDLLPSMADYALMKHVMTNLLSNAIKYSSTTKLPVIEIRSKQEDGATIYSVKDNGVGFDMDYAHKLFGVFQRLHSAEEFPGTGVGLAIVQRIIQKHEGKVWAEAKLKEGATFFFSLPGKI